MAKGSKTKCSCPGCLIVEVPKKPIIGWFAEGTFQVSANCKTVEKLSRIFMTAVVAAQKAAKKNGGWIEFEYDDEHPIRE